MKHIAVSLASKEYKGNSSTESEYMALDDVARVFLWERRNLGTVGFRASGSTLIGIDNQGAIEIANNLITHDTAVRYHYNRGLIWKKIVKLKYIDTRVIHADFLTKFFPHDKFVFHHDAIGNEAIPSSGVVEAKAMVEDEGRPADAGRANKEERRRTGDEHEEEPKDSTA